MLTLAKKFINLRTFVYKTKHARLFKNIYFKNPIPKILKDLFQNIYATYMKVISHFKLKNPERSLNFKLKKSRSITHKLIRIC